ncbi:glutathione S-transferase 1 [Drosophila grimshawi]|uniref:GH19714 n=1 Tax=Drosophila grimshawi TaxID=7222 RepID=B4J4N7_DROGR|nr:glutathione S-transferase 1 [Drosophila grimshawi]XP_032591045.1 glutathione S-transferase 1 [Drosophila grimshawi]EDW02742.1 GH19714 [Drosophila grimshawi]
MASKPVLYYNSRSPPCRGVLLTAAALGLDLDLRSLTVKAGENMTPQFLKLNPLHTIPVLDDNGTVVSDSHVICCYLVDKYAKDGDALYPKDPAQRREVDARLYFDCGHLFPRVRFIVEPLFYFGATAIPEDRITYMQKAYDGLEHCLATAPYLAGANLTIADLCSVSSVSTAAAFAPIDAEKYPKLSQWLARLQALPYYKANNEEGLQILIKLAKSVLVEQ